MREYFLSENEKKKIENLQNKESRKFNIGDKFYFLLDDKIVGGIIESIGISPKGDKVLYFFSEYCFSCDMMYLTPRGLCDGLIEEYKFRTVCSYALNGDKL